MTRKLFVIAGVAALAVAALALFTGFAFAQGGGPEGHGYGKHGLLGTRGQDVAVGVAAELTGLTPEQVYDELQGGTTLPSLIEEKGVSLEEFQAAVQDAHQEAVTQALAEGRITEAQAQRIQERTQECIDDGDCCGTGPLGPRMPGEDGYGEPGLGTGPGLMHRYGPGAR